MEDRDLMESELLTIKGVCDLYLHGSLESTIGKVYIPRPKNKIDYGSV